MLRPALLVGLGDAGAEVASGVLAALADESGDPGLLAGGIVLTAGGMRSVRTLPLPEEPPDRLPHGDCGLRSGPLRWGHHTPETTDGFPIESCPDGSVAEACPQSYAEWHRLHMGRGRDMKALLLNEAHHVRNHATISRLEQRGYSVSELLHVLVVAPCFDAAGSTALRVVLGVLDDLFRDALAELPHEIHLILLAPDLAACPAGGEAAAYARSYACVQELEATLEGTSGCRLVPVDDVWLCSGRNGADLFLGPGPELVSVLVAHAAEVVRGAPVSEPASSPTTRQRLFGRATRYSTFGQARLIFPRDELLVAARQVAVGEELQTLPYLQIVKLPVATAFAMVGRFANEHLDGLEQRLSVMPDKRPIFQPFDASALDGTGPALVTRIQDRHTEYGELFRRTEEDLDARNLDLSAAVKKALADQVQQLMHASGAGALGRAQAWLAAAGNFAMGHQKYISGEAGAYSDDAIPSVLERSWVERLEERFARFVFNNDSELVKSYIGENPELCGNRRKLLRQVQEDIASRARQLEDHHARRARLEAQIPTEDSEGSAPGGHAGEGSPPASDPGLVSGLHEQVQKKALEFEIATISRLSADFERLHLLRHELEPQVEEMDRVIRDAVARRRLFQRIEEEGRERGAGLSNEYLRLHEAHAEALSALAAAGFRLLAWSTVVGGAALVLAAVMAFQFRNAKLTGLVAAVAVTTAVWWVWTGPVQRYRDAEKKEKEALAACKVARTKLVKHWDTLASDRFSDRVSAVAAEWSKWVPELILEWNEKLETFRGVMAAAGDHTGEVAKWQPEPAFFVEKLSPPDGARALVRQRAGKLRARFDNYWQGHPFAESIRAYLHEDVASEDLLYALRVVADEAFGDLREMSVEAYLRSVADAESRQRVVDRLFRAAAPLARGVARPHDPVTELTYVALSEPPGRSAVMRALADMGQRSVHHRQSPSDTIVTISRVAVGYAAFQLAILREARGYLLQHEVEQRRAFYIEPNQMEALSDLLPVPSLGLRVGLSGASTQRTALRAGGKRTFPGR